MEGLAIVLWAIVPPLLWLLYYGTRVRVIPPLPWVLLLFFLGSLAGWLALLLLSHAELWLAQVRWWQQLTRMLMGVTLRQLVLVGPVEEGCKLAAVALPLGYIQWRYRQLPAQPGIVLLLTLVVGLGFAAQENLVYLIHGISSGPERAIGAPAHALFSAPWGYALGIILYRPGRLALPRYRWLLLRAWWAGVACHALVNLCGNAWNYPPPERWFGYGLFPFLLWLLWQVDGLVRRSQGEPPLPLITGRHRLWQVGLACFALILGGNTLLGLLLLARRLRFLSLEQVITTDPDLTQFLADRLVLTLIPGVIALFIYRYLRRRADRVR